MGSRAEAFAAAKARRKEQKAEEAQRGQGGGASWDELNYVALDNNLDVVMRILGAPADARVDKTDPKSFEMSMIMGDNGKKFLCIWPDREDGDSWLLRRVTSLVLTSSWDNESNQKIFRYANSHKEVFDQVAKNGRPDQKYESGWPSSKKVFMSVLARDMMDWHRENKKTVMVSKKMNVYDDGRTFYDRGIPMKGYTTIWDEVVEYSGDWENYDISLRRIPEDPWYRAFHGVDDARKLTEKAQQLVVEGPITDEERSWERQDIDKITQVTSYGKLKAKLKNKLALVDSHFNTKFHEELLDLASKEDAEKKAKAEREADEETGDQPATKTQVVVEKEVPTEKAVEPEVVVRENTPIQAAPKETPVRGSRRSAAVPTIDWEGLISGEFNGTKYLGVASMTEDEKSMVTGVDEGGQFAYVAEWKGEAVSLLAEEKSGFGSPEQFHVCPLTGVTF